MEKEKWDTWMDEGRVDIRRVKEEKRRINTRKKS